MGQEHLCSVASPGFIERQYVMEKKPDIFDFIDAVLFLNSYFEFRKKQDSRFSYTAWARELGLGNKTLLRFILQKKRQISPKIAQVFKQNLGLDFDQEKYFDLLISYSQSKSDIDRNAYGALLIRSQRQRQAPSLIDASVAAKNSYAPVVLSVLTYKETEMDLLKLSQFLQVSVKFLEPIVEDLIQSQLLKRDDRGVLTFEGRQFRIPDADRQKGLEEFHRFWLTKSIEALQAPSSTRKFRSLKLALSEEEFAKALEKINDFAFAFLSQFSQDSIAGRKLYMFESVFFPISAAFAEDREVDRLVSHQQNL